MEVANCRQITPGGLKWDTYIGIIGPSSLARCGMYSPERSAVLVFEPSAQRHETDHWSA